MRIVFMGTPQAAVPSLRRLIGSGHDVAAVYTQPDRPSGRGNKITFSPVKQFALDAGFPVFQPSKINSDEAIGHFRSHSADVAVVVAYGRILPEPYLTAFPKGAVNVHFSLLPKYRGAAPVNWAIVNGEVVTGVTTIKMDAGLDTGDILLQESVDILSDETSIGLMERLSTVGAKLLCETLGRFDSIVPRPQDHSAASCAPMMRKGDGVINWRASAVEISARIRGFQPFPSSFTIFRDVRLTIWQARPIGFLGIRNGGHAGSIADVSGDNLIVECGNGTYLCIDEVQPEGKRRMQARDFINGSRPILGEVLG
jgi:methionyl-tRNA formyltransferase